MWKNDQRQRKWYKQIGIYINLKGGDTVAINTSLVTHDPMVIDRLLAEIGDLYYRAIMSGHFDVDKYKKDHEADVAKNET